jgi:hypothetical protein
MRRTTAKPASLSRQATRPAFAAPVIAALFAAAFTSWAHAGDGPGCEATSGATPPVVVELYTSEGCSSCPPADRWLSSLNDAPGLLPLAFHVNYWDRLGWQDRFATPATTQRQHQVRAVHNGKYVYTPQILLNGKDHKGWFRQSPSEVGQSARPAPSAVPSLKLRREGNNVTATVGASTSAPSLAGYWAVLQDGLSSKVTRGENAGETLTHDHVVSLYQPVAAWSAGQPRQWHLSLPAGPQFEALRVAFVVTLPDLVQPVQGLALRCPS